MSVSPRVLILHATGTNRDREALLACQRAGGQAEIVHVNQLRDGARRLADYQMLVLPGGFSYGDDLGAGRLWASDLAHLLQDQVTPFVEAGKPVIGICNGFQALVKSGWLPGLPLCRCVPAGDSGKRIDEGSHPCRCEERSDEATPKATDNVGGDRCRWKPADATAPRDDKTEGGRATATLTYNASNHFECRWVWLEPNPDSPCVFTRGLSEPIYCPVAHGEGRFVPRDQGVLDALERGGQVALRYAAPPDIARASAAPTSAGGVGYPYNPNGSVADIAGVCSPAGTVFGLMPHPEDHIFPEQHPRWTRGERGHLGLALFQNGIVYAAQI